MKGIGIKNWRGWQIDVLGACACALLTGVTVFLGFVPLHRSRVGLDAKRQRLDMQRRRSAALERSLVVTKRRLKETQEALADSELRLEPASGLNQRIARLTDLAIGSGLKIDDVSLGRQAGTARHTAVPICLAGTGPYRKCVAFLRKLNQTFADTAVTTSDLSAGQTDPAASFRFELVWYAAPPVGAGGK